MVEPISNSTGDNTETQEAWQQAENRLNKFASDLFPLLPPPTNRGVVKPKVLPAVRVLIDWLDFTVAMEPTETEYQEELLQGPVLDPIMLNLYRVLVQVPIRKRVLRLVEVMEWFGGESEFMLMPKGSRGYSTMHQSGHVRILSNGAKNAGIHVSISGRGCRQVEALESWQGWQALLLMLKARRASIARLDLAFDDLSGILDYKLIKESISNLCLVSKWRDCTSGDATNIKTGLPRALVTHFGSMTSDASGKFYDKALQMQDTKESSDLGADHWLRFEILFRDSRAEQVADYFCQSGDLVACVGILRNYVDFKERPAKEGEQRSRLPTVSWWNDFCMACEKVQLWQGPKIRTIEDRAEWMAYQGSKTLAMVTEAYSGDMSWITDMIEAGKARLTDNDRCLITRFKNNEI